MGKHLFARIGREHESLLAALTRLDVAAGPDGSARLASAVAEFLTRQAAPLEAHLAFEEAEVFPLLDRRLSPDSDACAALREEHQTVRSLIASLRSGQGRLRWRDHRAHVEVATTARDLALLLKDHIRKEDGTVYPLLRRLLDEDRR